MKDSLRKGKREDNSIVHKQKVDYILCLSLKIAPLG